MVKEMEEVVSRSPFLDIFRQLHVDIESNLIKNLEELLRLFDEGSREGRTVENEGKSMEERRRMRKMCNFCKMNGDPKDFYTSHNLREDGFVTCPILQKHVCELCGASGPQAHTRSYCKVAAAGREVFSGHRHCASYHNMTILKKTALNAAGKRRFPPRCR